MDYTFDFSFLETHGDALLKGTWLSIKMSVLSLLLGFICGTTLAVLRHQGPRPIQKAVRVFIDLNRNTPLVIQTFWLFFGLAALDIRIPAFYAAVIALTINTAAYTCEIVRAGMASIHAGQLEAAVSLSLSRWQVLRHIILPQAIEKMFPSLISQFVLMMLATSIMSQISAEELTGIGYGIQSETFRGFEVYLVIAGIYLVLSWLLRIAMTLCYLSAFPKQRQPAGRARGAA